MEPDASKQPPQHPSLQEEGNQTLEPRTTEATCQLPRGVVYDLIALARAKVDWLIKKEETGVAQSFLEGIEFSLPLRAVADSRRRMDQESLTQGRASDAPDGKAKKARHAAASERRRC